MRSKTITSNKEGETVVFAKEIDASVPDYEGLIEEISTQIKIEDINHEGVV